MTPEITQEVIKKLEELRDSLQQTENSYATNKCVEILDLIRIERVFESEPIIYSATTEIGNRIVYGVYHEEDVHEVATDHKKLIEINDGSTQVVSEEKLKQKE